jgi:hypothetical protein
LLSALAIQSSGYVTPGVMSQAMPNAVLDTADRPLFLAVGNVTNSVRCYRFSEFPNLPPMRVSR